MKKAIVGILMTSLLLASFAAAAFAADPVNRSDQAKAMLDARRALAADYGLTPVTIGLFHMEWEQDGDTWIVQFHPIGFAPRPLGTYRVTLAPGKAAQTHWTYDDIDPEAWQSGSLESPVWGQAQLLALLEDRQSAVDALARQNPDWLAEASYAPQMPPGMDALAEDESIWYGEILRNAKPGPEDIPQAKATALAARAILEESSLTAREMNTAEILTDFTTRDGGNPLWSFSFQFFLRGGGIYQDWGVVVDARTGEILLTNIVSGSEG